MDAYELLPSYPTRYEAASLCPINDVVPVQSEPYVQDITPYANAMQHDALPCDKCHIQIPYTQYPNTMYSMMEKENSS